jgi:hypothetical protein
MNFGILAFSTYGVDSGSSESVVRDLSGEAAFPLLFFPDGVDSDRWKIPSDGIFVMRKGSQLERNISLQDSCDIVAKRLAGLYFDSEDPSQVEYAESISKSWEKLNDSLLKILTWSAKYIAPLLLQSEATTLFYPFGGPDIAYTLALFPQMNNYILVGLEPIGTFDNIKKTIKNSATLAALRRSLSSYFKKGYFITSEMMTQLSNKNIRGALYIILVGLARNNCTVTQVTDISIDPDGNEVPRQKGMPDGVKITFNPPGSMAQKSVYYIRANLIDSNKKLFYLMNFVKHTRFVTLIKSASYVLHDVSASQIRNFLLGFSAAVLQDDTGIPFSYFSTGWEVYPYGSYKNPALRIFMGYLQRDLRNFFATRNPLELPFMIGYGFNQDHSCLILAVSLKKSKN